MRFAKLAMVAALAVALRPGSALGQEPSPRQDTPAMMPTTPAEPIDHRLLISASQRRATLAHVQGGTELRQDKWNLYGATEYMAWGMFPGFLIGMLVGGATSDGGLLVMADILGGGIIGGLVGGTAGIVYYTIGTL
jgi:hypothetical protein